MQAGTVLTSTSLLLSGLLVLAAIFSDGRPAFAQAQLDCPLPASVTPPAPPRVTAQQVENGRASLRDFALAARDQLAIERTGVAQIYVRCLVRQEGSPWRSGSTYLIILTPDGRVNIHAKDMALSGRQLTPGIYRAVLDAVGIDPAALPDPAAVLAAIPAAAAGDGGSFDVPDVPGASGYATVYFSAGLQQPFVLLAGFALSASHVVSIRALSGNAEASGGLCKRAGV